MLIVVEGSSRFGYNFINPISAIVLRLSCDGTAGTPGMATVRPTAKQPDLRDGPSLGLLHLLRSVGCLPVCWLWTVT